MAQNPTINVMNRSTVLNDTAVRDMMNAVQYQVTHDFAPRWGIGARFHFVGLKEPAPLGAWSMVILDTSDVAGALGYHDLTPDGFPIGKVFAKTTLQYGGEVSVTLSHEVLEALGDPHINLGVQGADGGTWFAYENCDAVEADNFAYRRVGQLVSDFVLPEYFDWQTHKRELSFKNHVSAPFQVAPGGYMSFWTPNGGWQQQTNFHGVNPKAEADSIPRVGSRRERRARPRYLWQRSAAAGPVLAEPEL